ncbi:MAG: hypothetical protein RSD96_02130 [Bacilli bacterium]
MKKILFVVSMLLSIIFSIKVQACTYSDEVELNKLASYTTYTYDYIDSTKMFNIKIINIPQELMVNNKKEFIGPINNIVEINNIEMGSSLDIGIYASIKSSCPDKRLRTLYIRLPYKNEYYGTQSCVGYETTEVCKSKFLPYNLTSKIFRDYIRDYKVSSVSKEESSIIITKDDNIMNVIKDISVNNFTIFILIIIPLNLILLIGIIILRKKKIKF